MICLSSNGNVITMYLFVQNFYKEMGREEIYIRYIYHLAELHNTSGNWVEAGFTLLLHAQLLQVNHLYKCFT